MNMPGLEDHLHDLATRVAAPATEAARQAVGRRARVLRRRRQARNAIGAGLVIVAVLAGGLALRGKPAAIETGPATTGTNDGDADTGGRVPALTVDLDGWAIAQGAEDGPSSARLERAAFEGSFQVFRRPGELSGPTVFLTHSGAGDAVVPEPGEDEPVGVGEATGYLSSPGPATYVLKWNALGDSQVVLHSWRLSRDEVLDFANGLEAKDEDGEIQNPSLPDDQFGFVASVKPQGLEEVELPSVTRDPSNERVVGLAQDGQETVSVELRTWRGNEWDFEADLDELLRTDGEVSTVSVGDRPAVLIHYPGILWVLRWRPNEHTVASMTANDVDQSTMDELVAHIRELPEDDWPAAVPDDPLSRGDTRWDGLEVLGIEASVRAAGV